MVAPFCNSNKLNSARKIENGHVPAHVPAKTCHTTHFQLAEKTENDSLPSIIEENISPETSLMFFELLIIFSTPFVSKTTIILIYQFKPLLL